MKKILLILLLTIPFFCFSQDYVLTKDLKERNDVVYYNGEKFSGFEYSYQENGLLQMICQYKNGLHDGHYTWFYGDGNPNYVNQFKSGLHHGWCNMWWENGILWYRGYYNNGKVDPGSMRCWDKSGNKISCD
tara:strand:+ start:163 stop:558 length:396 start_codon:yes stop_codon:yes gene_type:complete